MKISHDGYRYTAEQDGITVRDKLRRRAVERCGRAVLEAQASAAGFINTQTGEPDVDHFLRMRP